MVKQPGVVNWSKLMEVTPEMKKIKKDKINKDSPLGIRLISEAEARCQKACRTQMRVAGVDSMWKAISHVRKVPWDQTQAVISIIKNEKKKEVLFRWRARGAITP